LILLIIEFSKAEMHQDRAVRQLPNPISAGWRPCSEIEHANGDATGGTRLPRMPACRRRQRTANADGALSFTSRVQLTVDKDTSLVRQETANEDLCLVRGVDGPEGKAVYVARDDNQPLC
jgi:hypothetical protein